MAAPRKPAKASSNKAPPAKAKPRPKTAAKPVPAPRAAVRPEPRPIARPEPRPAPRPEPVGPPPEPIDPAWVKEIKESLIERRQALNAVMQSNRQQLASNEGDAADIADRASDGFEDELTAGLLNIEGGQLEQVDEALARIEKGVYGLCVTCGKPIPRKRLDILPFAKRCLKCEGEKERARPAFDTGEDEGDGAEEEEEAESE